MLTLSFPFTSQTIYTKHMTILPIHIPYPPFHLVSPPSKISLFILSLPLPLCMPSPSFLFTSETIYYTTHISRPSRYPRSSELPLRFLIFFFLIRRKYSWCRSLSSKIPVLSSRLCSPTLSPTNSTENQLSVTLYRCSILQMLRKWWKDKK